MQFCYLSVFLTQVGIRLAQQNDWVILAFRINIITDY